MNIPLPLEIQKIIGRKDNYEEIFIEIVGILMYIYHLSFEECKKLPFPTAIKLLNLIKKMEKEINKISKIRR